MDKDQIEIMEHNNKIMKQVLERDNYTCVKCGRRKADGYKMYVDRVDPLARFELWELENSQTVCEADFFAPHYIENPMDKTTKEFQDFVKGALDHLSETMPAKKGNNMNRFSLTITPKHFDILGPIAAVADFIDGDILECKVNDPRGLIDFLGHLNFYLKGLDADNELFNYSIKANVELMDMAKDLREVADLIEKFAEQAEKDSN